MSILVIEDGTCATASANSYITAAELSTFVNHYGLTVAAATLASTSLLEQAILRGMAHVESDYNFKGYQTSVDNPLQWPRACVYSDNPSYLSDWDIYVNEIPKGLKNAVCRAAYEELASPGSLQPSAQSNIQSETVDVISTSYFRSEPSKTIYPVIIGFLKGLIKTKGNAEVKRV